MALGGFPETSTELFRTPYCSLHEKPGGSPWTSKKAQLTALL